MGDAIDSGALFHYRLNFIIYVVTCIFSLIQAIQGSLFFTVVTALTCVLAVIIGTFIVHAVVEQDIKAMEESEEKASEEKASEENPEEATDKD